MHLVLDADFLLNLLSYGIPRNLGIVALAAAACTFRNFSICFFKAQFWFKKASKMSEKTKQNAPKRRQNSNHFEHMIGKCASSMRPKSENVKKVIVFNAFLKDS